MKPNLQMSIALCLAAGNAFAQANAGDAAALATLTAINEHATAAAALATGRQLDPAVMQYAKTLQSAHRDDQQEIERLSKTAGVKPVDTSRVAALKRKTHEQRRSLAALDGPAFQAAYVQAMVRDHAEALETIDKELLPAARNADVAAHLRAARAHIAQHLEQARSLATGIAAGD